MTIWLIMWRLHDGSDCGVIDRAFTDEDEARWFTQTLIDQTGSSIYNLITVEVKEK